MTDLTQNTELDQMREEFEAKIRKLNPKELFIARWPDGSYKHHGTDGRWEGWKMARRTQPAYAGADGLPLMSKRAVDDIVYACRQSGKDTTYDIVNAAIAADRRARKDAAMQEPGAGAEE